MPIAAESQSLLGTFLLLLLVPIPVLVLLGVQLRIIKRATTAKNRRSCPRCGHWRTDDNDDCACSEA